jgi:dihydrolipoamide dehydrogenase
MPIATLEAELLVLGSGPGGYSAAYRAADLGMKVVLVEKEAELGGVCLNVGCIPSKALLHAVKVIDEAEHMGECGIQFGKPKIDNKKLRVWKDSVIKRLTTGLRGLAKQRNITVVHGVGEFSGPTTLRIKGAAGEQEVKFKQAIIAVGSEPVQLPFLPKDPRVMDSTGALELEQIDGEILVIGGGIIGMEMATVYQGLGSKVTVVEMLDSLMAGADKDIVAPMQKRIQKSLNAIYFNTKVTQVEAKKDGLWVTFVGDKAPDKPVRFDRILCAVGRKPNGLMINAKAAGVNVDDRGFIAVDRQLRTNVTHIFAIGDVIGNPMLAHKSVAEGRIAAEVASGLKHFFDAKVIPSVAYTDPEVAWVGLTETEAKAKNIAYEKGSFPWAASGRSLAMGRDEGLTKILFDPKSHRVLGAGIVGTNAGELISEMALAIEMGCEAADIALTIHPHPTLSETVANAVEVFEGTVTDIYVPKKKKAE